tara:strand:+ start:625 stop:1347 length:723 start_codon:yes stop_codon:yes gene_type:complete
MISKGHIMKLKNGSIDCFIPCRKKGDFINNLNFLELEGIKLVEHSIITAERTKLFENIYLITNDKNSAEELITKYPYIKLILVKNTRDPFYKMIRKNNYKINNLSENICVLLPNYPFKSSITIKKIYNEFIKKKLNLIFSITKLNNFFYKDKNHYIDCVNFSKIARLKKDIKPLYKMGGGIFFYKKTNQELKINKFKKKETYLLNEHESFGIYSLYDFIKASGLFDIDSSILKKMTKNNN